MIESSSCCVSPLASYMLCSKLIGLISPARLRDQLCVFFSSLARFRYNLGGTAVPKYQGPGGLNSRGLFTYYLTVLGPEVCDQGVSGAFSSEVCGGKTGPGLILWS